MAIGAEEIRGDIGIAHVALGAGGAIPRPTRREHIGMNRHHDAARLEQRVDEQAGRALDGDGQGGQGRAPREAGEPLAQPVGGVRHSEAINDRPLGVEYTDLMQRAGPVDPDAIR